MPLSVQRGRVMRLEERLNQLVVCDDSGIKCNLDYLSMTARPAAHFFVRRVF